jgi:hypothetical protein
LVIISLILFLDTELFGQDGRFGSETVIFNDGGSLWFLLSSRNCPSVDQFISFAYEYAFDFDNEWKEASDEMYDYLFSYQRVFRPNIAYIVRHVTELYDLPNFSGKKVRLISLRMVYFTQNYAKAYYFYTKSTVWEIVDDS